MEKFLMTIKLKQTSKKKHHLLYKPNNIIESRNNTLLASNKISKTQIDTNSIFKTTTMNQSTIDNISNIHNIERTLTTSNDNHNKKKLRIKEFISVTTKKKESKTDNENDTIENNNESIKKIPIIKDNKTLINQFTKNKRINIRRSYKK